MWGRTDAWGRLGDQPLGFLNETLSCLKLQLNSLWSAVSKKRHRKRGRTKSAKQHLDDSLWQIWYSHEVVLRTAKGFGSETRKMKKEFAEHCVTGTFSCPDAKNQSHKHNGCPRVVHFSHDTQITIPQFTHPSSFPYNLILANHGCFPYCPSQG